MAEDGKRAGGDAWGDEIRDERKAELERRLHAWELEVDHGERKGPFDAVRLSGADVTWLAMRVIKPQQEARQQEQFPIVTVVVPDLSYLHLEGCDLHGTHLEGSHLQGVHLEAADLSQAHLDGADLAGASLQGARLREAQLRGATFHETRLEWANLTGAHLEGADLSWAHLERAVLQVAHLERARLRGANLDGANLTGAHLDEADLTAAQLQWADLAGAHLAGAGLMDASMAGADLREAHLEGANLVRAKLNGILYGSHVGPEVETYYQRMLQVVKNFPRALPPADLRGAFLDTASSLDDITLGMPGDGPGQGYVRVADVRWGGVNLAVIKDWPQTMVLGDERAARAWQPPKREAAKQPGEAEKKRSRRELSEARRQQKQAWQDKVAAAEQERLELFRAAVRANRQLAMALREQGMNEEADRFAYRAQVCQRQVFRLRHQRVRQAFSWLLDAVSGHGYQPGKTLAWYLAVIFTFAVAYLAAAHGTLTFGLPPSSFSKLAWYEALVLSVSSFHGRGFLPFPNLGDPITILAAIEAVFGLFIEVSFIATFTQRYFGK